MASDRSYEGRHAAQQRYAVIEFCSNPEAAWAKIESGKYDWLGVKDSVFVFGRPPAAGGSSGGGALTVGTPGDDGSPATGGHVVEIRVPEGAGRVTRQMHATAEAARADFDATVGRLAKRDGSSGMFRVRLINGNAVEDQALVTRLLPNLL